MEEHPASGWKVGLTTVRKTGNLFFFPSSLCVLPRLTYTISLSFQQTTSLPCSRPLLYCMINSSDWPLQHGEPLLTRDQASELRWEFRRAHC